MGTMVGRKSRVRPTTCIVVSAPSKSWVESSANLRQHRRTCCPAPPGPHGGHPPLASLCPAAPPEALMHTPSRASGCGRGVYYSKLREEEASRLCCFLMPPTLKSGRLSNLCRIGSSASFLSERTRSGDGADGVGVRGGPTPRDGRGG